MDDCVCIIQQPAGGWLLLRKPRRVIAATLAQDVPGLLQEAEIEGCNGRYAVGFVTYEAAPAFDPACGVHPPSTASGLPLAWFAVFDGADPIATLPPVADDCRIGDWTPSLPVAEYRDKVTRILQWISAGDTYQVNYTFRMRAPFSGNPYALFRRLASRQAASFQAWIDTGRYAVCSASPELFFARNGNLLTARPMKGTIRRAPDADRDQRLARRLARSTKDRAENVMITDMIRNDLGRIAAPGSVRAGPLYEIERYPTLYQMTSTVTARSEVPLPMVFSALFPCASITGAPKIRTMQIIRTLEPDPRGLYTGAAGIILPGGDCRFNVAIRTAVLDRESGIAEYGVGSGIVWDSDPDGEYAECLLKTAVLTAPERPRFDLLETLLWDDGWFLGDRHLDRLAQSALYFGYPCESAALRDLLDRLATGFLSGPARRARITLSPVGRLDASYQPLTAPLPVAPRTVRWATDPVDMDDPLLYHKTTWRQPYETAMQGADGVDDVLLWNARGEATESTIANLVIQRNGRLLTPPVRCGLLGGTLRAELLARNIVRERVLTRRMVDTADAIWLVNSVRGWQRAVLSTSGAVPVVSNV